MTHFSTGILEFGALRQLLARYVASPLGHAGMDEIAPGTNRAELERTLAETGEAIEYLRTASQPQRAARGAAVRLRFDAGGDPREPAKRLAIEGSGLDGKEILCLIEWLDIASEARSLVSSTRERFPRLAAHAERIAEFRPMVAELAGKILPDGTLADHASVALSRIRRDIDRQRNAIQGSLERFLRLHQADGILQEDFVTIRNDRFVVPLVAGRQRKVEGVIHAASGSGHTLFLEPLETVELNNDLVRLREEEAREVHRILREMTARLRERAEAIAVALEVMAEIEVLFAKAQFALDFGGVIPRFSPEEAPRLALREGRHPLLEDVLRHQKRLIVPLSVTLEGGARTLLVSGPNTGGKTVAMKTVGLAVLMAQSGLPVPCTEAELPLFDRVLADIGDNQSIEQSLSTFSAHITRLREMLEEAAPGSLVLLDELGRATDPDEGGALGAAILDRFRMSGAFTLASTHLASLKVFGATTPGVVNGSMGFDEEALLPTYALRIGAPGKSAALDIAARLGLPSSLIEDARGRMSAASRDMGHFLAELERRMGEAEALSARLREEREALERKRQTLEKETAAREAAKLKEIDRRTEALIQKFDTEARATIEEITRGLESKRAADQALRRVARIERELRQEVDSTVLSVRGESQQGAPAPPKIEEGSLVRVRGMRDPARVRRRVNQDVIEVEAGFLKMQIGIDDVLEVVSGSAPAKKLPANVTFQPGPKWNVYEREINVIGQRAEEACENVERFLDNAVLTSVDRVRIVHGHGMGVLKRAIADLLAGSPHVERYFPASQSEGGAGATIAELKPAGA